MAYRNLVEEYKKNAVNSASPLKLVIMLYDGALRFMESGKEAILQKDYSRQNDYLQRAQKIVLELMSSLDMESGGEIAHNLMSLYSYVLQQLINANVYDQTDPVDTSIKIMSELRLSWMTLEDQLKTNSEEIAHAA